MTTTANGTALPTPEAMLALYLTGVRANGTVGPVARAERPEIREEVLELWENAHEPFQEADYDAVYPIAGIAAQAAILICQQETHP